jgi:2-keto-3-deoxy-L-rhamnonate aldolase RhmA
MRRQAAVGVVAMAALGVSLIGQNNRHVNPVVDLLIARQPVFGTAMPTAGGGGGGGGIGGGGLGGGAGAATTGAAAPATPAPAAAPAKTPLDLAKDALAHPEIDYFFTGSMERGVSTPGRNGGPAPIVGFTQFADAVVEAGGITTKPAPRLRVPLAAKTPNISRADSPADPAIYVDNISKQLNAGMSILNFVEVDNVDEIHKGIAAMRFASKGGTRPEAIGDAAKYWGLSEKEYRAKADVWPLSADGNLLAWAIIETREGVENVREIAQVKGLSAVIVGAGTLGGVYSTTNAEGRRVRDDAAWEAAIQKILAACKEFKKACGYPAYETDIEARMKQGFDVFIIQAFSERGFKAVEIGRQVSGRDKGR